MHITMKSKYEHLRIIYNRSKFNWYWSIPFLAAWFILFYLVVITNFYQDPEILPLEAEIDQPGRFIGERAEATLKRLIQIGPRVVGSEANKMKAVHFLIGEFSRINDTVRHDLYDLELDIQIASGNFVLWRMINAYQSIQNVVMRLRPRGSNSTASLLINSHYDTVPGSAGAGDDGIMVAVMLETLRVLAKYETPLTHSLVFLFNGAEENPLQGSHAFITQHKWAKDVKAVINLDSAGSGGREILFQSGPDHPWLMKYYSSSIVYPFATTVAEELFQNDFVPSETDFLIFRDFGHLPGLDLAHVYNGYVYHTKYDSQSLIPRSTYQTTGENLLALCKALANAPEMEDPEKHTEGHTVYFDVLGWYMIYYSESTGLIINISVCVLALVSIVAYIWNMSHQTGMFRRRIFGKFLILFGIQLLAVIFALILTLSIGFALDTFGYSMSWYSQRWLIFGLYYCPMFFALGIVPASYLSYTKEHGLPLGYAIQLIMHAHCLILTVITIVLISFGIRSAFMFVMCIGFYVLSVLLNIVTCLHKRTFLWLVPHIICQLFPFVFYANACYTFYEVFIPMQGRIGQGNPDLLIAGFTAIMCLLLVPFIVPLLCLFRKSKTIFCLFGAICLVFLTLAYTPIAFPYTEREAPQRFYALHTLRIFHDGDPRQTIRKVDSGFYVVPVDRHPNSLDYLFQDSNYSKAGKEDCDKELVCGYPIYSTRWFDWIDQSFWIPAPAPHGDGWPVLRIRYKANVSSTNIVYTLELSGPDHMGLFIQPLNDTRLVDWTFDKQPLVQGFGPPYFVYMSYDLGAKTQRFNLEFQRSSSKWTGPAFDIAVIGHKMHHDIQNTDDFREFLASLPKWAHVTAWSSSYESWRL